MKIDRIECKTSGDTTVLSARLAWEQSQRTERLWYKWPSAFANDVVASPAAVLVATLPLAVATGERRIAMAEPVDAFLYDHLRNVLGLFSARDAVMPPDLEVECESALAAPPAGRRAAVCLSGGVDSLAALAENHGALAKDHPERFSDAFYLFGLNSYDFEGGQPVRARVAWNREYGGRLRTYCESIGMTLIPIAMNVRSLYASWATWRGFGQASVLAAAAHAMPGRVHALTIAGAGDGDVLAVSGTRPALDPLYSSYSLDVRTVHGSLPRQEKIQLVARDPAALSILRVCLTFDVPAAGGTAYNCGKCEKCLRTMLPLVIHGALDRAASFPVRDVTPAMLESLEIDLTVGWQVATYRTLASMLRECGRGDLAHTIEDRFRHFERQQSQPPRSLLQRVFGG